MNDINTAKSKHESKIFMVLFISFILIKVCYRNLSRLLDVSEPALPRKRRRPTRLEEGDGPAFMHSTARDYYKSIYFEFLDHTIQSVKDRFNQPGFEMYKNLQDLVMCAIKGENFHPLLSPDFIELYCDDVDISRLTVQLDILAGSFQSSGLSAPTFSDCIQWFLSKKDLHRMLSEVKILFKLLLVLPATNAISERSFSTLRRLKTYLRASMRGERLNDLMMLNIYKEHNDSIDPQAIIRSYVGNSERRGQRIHVAAR